MSKNTEAAATAGQVTEIEPAAAAEQAPKVRPGDELVELMLFKDSNKYKGDVFVAVNGVGCQIRRGVPVQIKKKYADVLKQSLDADNNTELLKEGFSSSSSEKSS